MWNYVSVENPGGSPLQRDLSKKIGEILTLSISKMKVSAQSSYNDVNERVTVLLLEVVSTERRSADVYTWESLERESNHCYDLMEVSWIDSTYNDRAIIKVLFKGAPSYMRIERRNITSYPALDCAIKMKISSQ